MRKNGRLFGVLVQRRAAPLTMTPTYMNCAAESAHADEASAAVAENCSAAAAWRRGVVAPNRCFEERRLGGASVRRARRP